MDEQQEGRSSSLRHNVSDSPFPLPSQNGGRKRPRRSSVSEEPSLHYHHYPLRQEPSGQLLFDVPDYHAFLHGVPSSLAAMGTRKRPVDSASYNHPHLLHQSSYLPQQVKRARYETPVAAAAVFHPPPPPPPPPSHVARRPIVELENRPPQVKAQRRSLLTQQQQFDHFTHLLQSPPFFQPTGEQRDHYHHHQYIYPFEEEEEDNAVCSSLEHQLPNYYRRRPPISGPSVQTIQSQLPHSMTENERDRMMANELVWDAVATMRRKTAAQKTSVTGPPKDSSRPTVPIGLLSHHLRPSTPSSPLRPRAHQTTPAAAGNVSPAHSDSSTDETTSTCSSDDQNLLLFASGGSGIGASSSQRSFRERENYEAMMELAASISNPTRFTPFDVQQFYSYRYKPLAGIDGAACVICMCPFRSRQNIRVLPCNHEYHSRCIAKWLTVKTSCPICRRDLRSATKNVPTIVAGVKQVLS